jgi:uncharacterized membrane protein SirB2
MENPDDGFVIEFCTQIKAVHIVAVVMSGLLFATRGGFAIVGARWPYLAGVRYLSYAIDSVLLTAALMLATVLPAALFANHWLTVKLLLVVFYIVLGVFALRRGRAERVRRTCFAVALLTYLAIVGIAVAHHPLGWVQLLSR